MGAGKDDFRAIPDKPDGDAVVYLFEYHKGAVHDPSPSIPRADWADLCGYADADDFEGFDEAVADLMPAWWSKWGESARRQFMASLKARNG